MRENDITTQTKSEMKICCQALEEKKAIDLKVLDVRGKSTVTDYFIIATGNSQPHLRALKESLKKEFKAHKMTTYGTDAVPGSGWVVIDVFDFIIHIFDDDTRENYQIEALWKDAVEIDPKILLN